MSEKPRTYSAVFTAADGAEQTLERSGVPYPRVYFALSYPLKLSAILTETTCPQPAQKRAYELESFDGKVAYYREVEE